MARELIHRFEQNGTRFALDPETCFCFECDAISWDVLEYYPQTPINKILHELGGKYDPKELSEVVGELEWLRSTKSILKTPSQDEIAKLYELEKGVKRLTLRLPGNATQDLPKRRGWFPADRASEPGRSGSGLAPAAIALLLGRSAAQKELRLELVVEQRLHNVDETAAICVDAVKAANLAGKKLTVCVRIANVQVAKAPGPLQGHTLDVSVEFQDTSDVTAWIRGLAFDGPVSLDRLAKIVQPGANGVTGRIIVRPNHAEFGDAVKTLRDSGFAAIELDLDSAYAVTPALNPSDLLTGLGQTAMYYAQCLLKHDYFRLDPIAPLFMRIYEGAPMRRGDPAGTNELALDERGGIYPSPKLIGREEFKLGNLDDGQLDEDRLKQFEDVGSLTTPECLQCWARNLCGGGDAAVHYALSGSFRRPHAAWCEAQRAWMAAAVSAFQLLSSHGVNFTRMYGSLTPKARPSLFTMARAAFSLSIGMRPIEEADAELLVQWENWAETAYFLCNEKGMLLATKYDREMDSLHPEGLDRELVLIRKTGESFGLLKLRPEFSGASAKAWFYCRNEADYSSDAVRKGVRFVLKEVGGQQALRRVTVQAARHERALQAFLLGVGFEKLGVQREALYLHGKYEDVDVYGIDLERL
ncbi:MAG: SPASM domain-containing protein [Candidatus Hydrogenedentes bacterium]|nr:SPASM domain-containing protein [Candidatus Hydrogenedentota bacterium]